MRHPHPSPTLFRPWPRALFMLEHSLAQGHCTAICTFFQSPSRKIPTGGHFLRIAGVQNLAQYNPQP